MVSENQLHIVAVTAFIEQDGKFLILKRSDKEIANPGEWTIPGGKVEGTDSILETLIKEVKEETNLDVVEDCKFIGDAQFTRPDGYHVLIPRFKCKVLGEVKINKEDFTEFAWVGEENIDNYEIIKGVKNELLELMK